MLIQANHNDTRPLGERMKKARLERHWRRSRMADHLGTYEAKISLWEGGHEVPPGDKIKLIEEFIGDQT